MSGTIYIITSGNILSGGVSSMHNLCKGLIDCGFDAKIYYVYANEILIKEKIEPHFKIPRTFEIIDDEINTLIVPEILTHLFANYFHIRKVIYWLSLQFYFKNNFSYRWPLNIKLLRKPFYNKDFFNPKPGLSEYLKQSLLYWGIQKSYAWSDNIIHVTNSFYTYSFCKTIGAKQLHLLYNPIIDRIFSIQSIKKKNQILLGAKTSRLLVFYLKKFCIGYNIILLKGLPINKVYELMSESLVFAEFGISNRDRTPREAVILGCVVFTSNKGSAFYAEDVPIDDYYKINQSILNYRIIGKRILHAAKNYNDCVPNFDEYRNLIKEEKKSFSIRIKSIFDLILNKFEV
jgi:hypothetical protein